MELATENKITTGTNLHSVAHKMQITQQPCMLNFLLTYLLSFKPPAHIVAPTEHYDRHSKGFNLT